MTSRSAMCTLYLKKREIYKLNSYQSVGALSSSSGTFCLKHIDCWFLLSFLNSFLYSIDYHNTFFSEKKFYSINLKIFFLSFYLRSLFCIQVFTNIFLKHILVDKNNLLLSKGHPQSYCLSKNSCPILYSK